MVLSAVVLWPVAGQARPDYAYKVIPLVPFTPGQGSGVATMINHRGMICGLLGNGGFCWYRGKLTQLTPLAGDTFAYPRGLNDKNQVVGVSYSLDRPQRAVMFVQGRARSLSVASHLYSGANDINNLGQIAGGFSDTIGESMAYVSWHGTVRELGTLGGPRRIDAGFGINDRGQIVGDVSKPNTLSETGITVAFLYERGVMRALATPAGYGSHAVRINRSGQTVGWTEKIGGDIDGRRAVMWKNGARITLVDEPSDARGVNNLGQAVGGVYTREGGFLYTPGQGSRNLNELIDPASGYRLIYPEDINDKGQIVGYACKAELCGPVLLDPVHKVRSSHGTDTTSDDVEIRDDREP
jgi:uncharacterized membrane protein